MTKTVKPHIAYIIDSLALIKNHTPADRHIFMRDRNAQDATLIRLQDIGEQLSRIRDNFPEFFEANHDESWHKLIGLRNIISHGYREVDFGIIWDVVNGKLPDFAERMQELADSSTTM